MIKSKEEHERIMIACHASPEGKSSGLARIYPEFQSGGLQHCTSIEYEPGGGGGGGGGDHSCDRPNTSGEGEGRPNNTSSGRGEG